MKTVYYCEKYPTREIEVGDKIHAQGLTFEIAKILYWDDGGNLEDMCEFIDTLGNYHYWKQYFDGGYVIPKGENKNE